MTEMLLWVVLTLLTANLLLVGFLLLRSGKIDLRGVEEAVHSGLREGRNDAAKAARELREEITEGQRASAKGLQDGLNNMVQLHTSLLKQLSTELKQITESNQNALDRIRETLDARLRQLHEDNQKKLEEIRKTMEEKLGALEAIRTTLDNRIQEMSRGNEAKLEDMRKTIDERLSVLDKIRATIDDRLKVLQEGNENKLELMRKTVDEKLQTTLGSFQNTLDARIRELQQGNEKKLDEMRKTVDDKLHETLGQRLGESFKLVSNQLEAVHRGLGEMQQLAGGIDDLKRVLSNVKTRGTWGEVQLGAILDQVLAPGQYEKNVKTKEESDENVEYAIRLPGDPDESNSCVWLPIDAKFPQEAYVRLQKASDDGDAVEVQAALDELVRLVHLAAEAISSKYLDPPATTDFAIMFLATEGLYAEVVRIPSLCEELQHQYRVMVAGPSTLAAILCSLRMGFQAVAIGQRASDVWKVLSAVKTEFSKFGDVLKTAEKQLARVQRSIAQTGVRTRAMARKLKEVEQLPEAESERVLHLPLGDLALLDADEATNPNDDHAPQRSRTEGPPD